MFLELIAPVLSVRSRCCLGENVQVLGDPLHGVVVAMRRRGLVLQDALQQVRKAGREGGILRGNAEQHPDNLAIEVAKGRMCLHCDVASAHGLKALLYAQCPSIAF